MSIALTDIVKRNEELIFAQMGEEVVMMSEDQNEYLGLNVVASAIWDLVAAPQSVEQLCGRLQEQFVVPTDQCEREVVEFMDQMKQKKLIEVIRP